MIPKHRLLTTHERLKRSEHHLMRQHERLVKEHETLKREREQSKEKEKRLLELEKNLHELHTQHEVLKKELHLIGEKLPKVVEEMKTHQSQIETKLTQMPQEIKSALFEPLQSSGVNMIETITKSQESARETLNSSIKQLEKSLTEPTSDANIVKQQLEHLKDMRQFLENSDKERSDKKWFWGKENWNAYNLATGSLNLLQLVIACAGFGFGIYSLQELVESDKQQDRDIANKLKAWAHYPEQKFWLQFADFVRDQDILVYEQTRFVLLTQEMMQKLAPSKFVFDGKEQSQDIVKKLLDAAAQSNSYESMYRTIAHYAYLNQANDRVILPRITACELLLLAHSQLLANGISYPKTKS